jgi:hypothetical protein
MAGKQLVGPLHDLAQLKHLCEVIFAFDEKKNTFLYCIMFPLRHASIICG